MDREYVLRRLLELDPSIPWSHKFDFGHGLSSVSTNNLTYFNKAIGLHKIGEILAEIAESEVSGRTLVGKNVLDLACGEGGHSIIFARSGAHVLGIDGRTLYIDRARFVAEVLGLHNVRFESGDVRKLPATLQPHDIVICSGILHHLGVESFDGIMSTLERLTADILLLYTHVSTESSVKTHSLDGPVETPMGRRGYLFREHEDGATKLERETRVRASLDNTFSFWVQERDLITSLRQSGFRTVFKIMSPHVFGWDRASYRLLLIARK